jgi:hypothetical protein
MEEDPMKVGTLQCTFPFAGVVAERHEDSVMVLW